MLARIGLRTILLACILGPSACTIPLPECLTLSPFEEAASYDWMLNDKRYSEPLNAWVRNERLERFLLRGYRSGGLAALKSQFGFDCEPRPVIPACRDCYVCRASLPKQVAQQEEIPSGHLCTKSGEMLIQIDIGPGREAFAVMTYWQRPPLRPEAGK
jgi:hypothetical protein